MTEASDFLKDQEPAAGDPETLEAQLDQSEVSWFTFVDEFPEATNVTNLECALSCGFTVETSNFGKWSSPHI